MNAAKEKDVLKGFFLNMSIKYKILIIFCAVIGVIVSLLGIYWLNISRRNIISTVSTSNISINRQLNSHINFILNDITDISTNICIDDNVQTLLDYNVKNPVASPDTSLMANDSLKFIMNIIASKSYISFLILYGQQNSPVYYEFTDMSIGAKGLAEIRESSLYKTALSLDGSPLPVYLAKSDNPFIQRSTYPKIGICRIVKNYTNGSPVGFLIIGFNESTLQELCQNNIQNNSEGIMVVDSLGKVLSKSGSVFGETDCVNQAFYQDAQKNTEGYEIETISNAKYLITYGSMANGWKSFYAVPMASLSKEINSVKGFTAVIVLACFALSIPLIAFISSYLTAPMTALLKSMKRFQQGNFNERVGFKYRDEIGQLGEGYNDMVKSINELIQKTYVLQIREREAELNALQAQINPHFLYNTLDAIFWKAEMRKEDEISEMVYSLSRLFRLSLNRGERLTSVSNEQEMLTHYLLLQKIRLKNKLNYIINFSDDILSCIIPKLMLQPFVENAILHGLDCKEHGGTVLINGACVGNQLKFSIEDDGIGMDKETVSRLLESGKSEVPPGTGTSGYAVGNVYERLKIIYNDRFYLEIKSEKGNGTKVTIMIPVAPESDSREETDA